MEAPCKDCKERLIPKTCEKTCEKWKYYEKEKIKENKIVEQNKKLHQRLTDAIWRKKR